MIVKIYCIKDTLSGHFGEPFTAQNDEVAIRRFNYLMSKADMVADDCVLWYLADFNSETGFIFNTESSAEITAYKGGE